MSKPLLTKCTVCTVLDLNVFVHVSGSQNHWNMQRTDQAQTNTYTPTPCISVYLDPNWTRVKSSSSSDSSLLPWDMSDRAWNRKDKGLSRWGKRQDGGWGKKWKWWRHARKRIEGGIKRIKVESLKKSHGDKDDGMLEVRMLEAYFSCRCRFWKIHYSHFVCGFNSLSERYFYFFFYS